MFYIDSKEFIEYVAEYKATVNKADVEKAEREIRVLNDVEQLIGAMLGKSKEDGKIDSDELYRHLNNIKYENAGIDKAVEYDVLQRVINKLLEIMARES